MKKKIFEILPIIIALLLSLGVVTVFKACDPMEDGTWMHCHAAQNDVFILGLVIGGLGTIALLIKKKAVKIIVGVVNLGLGVLTSIVPGILVHLCMMHTMRCHSVMRPFVVIVSIILILTELVNVFLLVGKRKVYDEKRADKVFS
ncbi:MAG: DUF4418 family protein [Eubacterium sp.]|nr:DUF4418 family protein [Eubacterium sp.]